MINCCGNCGAGVVLLNTDGKTSFSDCLWAIATFTVYINSTMNSPKEILDHFACGTKSTPSMFCFMYVYSKMTLDQKHSSVSTLQLLACQDDYEHVLFYVRLQ